MTALEDRPGRHSLKGAMDFPSVHTQESVSTARMCTAAALLEGWIEEQPGQHCSDLNGSQNWGAALLTFLQVPPMEGQGQPMVRWVVAQVPIFPHQYCQFLA